VRSRFLLLLLAAGCAKEATPVGTQKPEPQSSHPVLRYFPLEEGKIYHYVTKEGDEQGMLVAKVRRSSETTGELQLSNATKRFTILPDGITYTGGPYVLKSPLDVGASWKGEHGGTTKIEKVDAAAQVPAGSYAGCLLTVEEGGRPQNVRYETTYCPGVGMVLLVVKSPMGEARAELKSYGFPVKIE
jgi:hypothetical protein